MIPQVQDDPQKPLEEQAPPPLAEKHSPTSTPAPQNRKMLKRDKRLHRQWNRWHFSTNDICSFLLATGLFLIVLGQLIGVNTFIGFILTNGGWVAFLIGIAMFAAIIKTELEV